MTGDLIKSVIVVIVPILVLFYNVIPASISDSKLVSAEWTADASFVSETNHTGHVYPYMASVVSMTCLLIILMLIICLGGNLG